MEGELSDGIKGELSEPLNGKSWTDVSSSISLPDGIRHGSVIPVPEKLIDSLQSDGK